METSKFTKNDNEFICENCGKKVEKLGYTSRDHCPYCLCSKHVDINPGDRQNSCEGILEPIEIQLNSKKGYVIIYKCKKCGERKKNIIAKDDDKEKMYEIIKNRAENI